MRRPGTIERMQQRVRDLTINFTRHIKAFNSEPVFTGPSLYFHLQAVRLLKECGGPARAVIDQRFVETLYATLTAWGMHRLGSRGAKLVEFGDFASSLAEAAPRLKEHANRRLADVAHDEMTHLAADIWSIAESLRVSATESRLVAASKTLHHLLPDLVPPIDRSYTVKYFYSHDALINSPASRVFGELLPCFHEIAVTKDAEITSFLGSGMNTSTMKVIDNAIVGCVRAIAITTGAEDMSP